MSLLQMFAPGKHSHGKCHRSGFIPSPATIFPRNIQQSARGRGPKGPGPFCFRMAPCHHLRANTQRDSQLLQGQHHPGWSGNATSKLRCPVEKQCTGKCRGTRVKAPAGRALLVRWLGHCQGSGPGLVALPWSLCHGSPRVRTHRHTQSSCLPRESAHRHGNGGDIRHCKRYSND